MRPDQRFCSPKCSSSWRNMNMSDEHRREQTRRAVQARIEANRARRNLKLMPLLALSPMETLDRCYQLGYAAGYSMGVRNGKAHADQWIARKEREWLAEGGISSDQ